jgi:methylenetetrahydrofolate dehydrogenase (NADP+)/methenyltetrahydrofolate cyclohydrolase
MTDCKRIDGKAFANTWTDQLQGFISAIKSEHRVQPGLAVVLVGHDPASQVYVKNKHKKAVELGITSFQHELDADITESELLTLVKGLNEDATVHGILVQLPLPKHIDEQKILNAIAPEKDVDGFHPMNVGLLSTGNADAFVPCTPLGCLYLLKDHFAPAFPGDMDAGLSGKNALIIGRSNIVGKPMAQLLLQESCTVTIAHSRTKDLPAKCQEADIVVAAVGRPEMVKGEWLKKGAVVIDVGINRIERDGKKKLVGDVDYKSAESIASAMTPVPGGVGPMTIAMLMHNTVKAALQQNNLRKLLKNMP